MLTNLGKNLYKFKLKALVLFYYCNHNSSSAAWNTNSNKLLLSCEITCCYVTPRFDGNVIGQVNADLSVKRCCGAGGGAGEPHKPRNIAAPPSDIKKWGSLRHEINKG